MPKVVEAYEALSTIAMKELKLTQGKVALVDDADYEWLSTFHWQYSTSTGYARTTVKAKKKSLHQLLLPSVAGKVADHINWNKLDNRRCNLRLVTKSENNRHKPLLKTNTSGITGVIRHTQNASWVAQASINNVNYYIGSFPTLEKAASARTDFIERLMVDPASIKPKGPLQRNNTSGFRGVYRNRNGTWNAQVNNKGQHIYLGRFATPAKASAAVKDFHAK